MKTKTVPATYTSVPNGDEAAFEAIVAVFNNEDFVGDVGRPGMFKNSIAWWKNSGEPMPVLWSHRFDDPHMNIGYVADMDEVGPGDKRIPDNAHPWVKANGGLWVQAALDDHGVAQQVRHLLKTRRVRQFSYSYDTVQERLNSKGQNELLDVFVHEIGPTPLGANPLTELIGAKSQHPPPDDDKPDTEPREKQFAGFFRACFSAAIDARTRHALSDSTD